MRALCCLCNLGLNQMATPTEVMPAPPVHKPRTLPIPRHVHFSIFITVSRIYINITVKRKKSQFSKLIEWNFVQFVCGHCEFLHKNAIFVILINIAHALRYEQQNAHTALFAQCQLVKLTEQREHERAHKQEPKAAWKWCLCVCVGVPKGRMVTSLVDAALTTASTH